MSETIKITGLTAELYAAQDAAKEADNNWQAELDRQGIERYSKQARGTQGSVLRNLYDRKVATADRQADLTSIIRRYQDPNQIARP